MTPPTPDCTTCKFYFTKPPQQGGACRRMPPTAHLAGRNPMGQPITFSCYPTTGKGDWCGEYVVRVTLNS